jgi:phosphoribosylglycinamide formyltransferase-1
MSNSKDNHFRLAIFASGGGSNAERIILYFKGHSYIHVSLIVSNKQRAGVRDIAAKHGIKFIYIDKENFYNKPESTLAMLQKHKITHIVLAGFLWLVPRYLIDRFLNKIVNIHPALLPKYGGKGMYGHFVHKAVYESGDKVSGPTIHLVNEKYDEGDILFQKSVDISHCKNADEIAKTVLDVEHEFYAKIIESYLLGDYTMS